MALGQEIKKVLAGGGSELVNYDFFDIAAGTGVITFYLGQTSYNGASSAILSNQTFYSDKVATVFQTAASPVSSQLSGSIWTKFQDLDFDVALNKPLNFKGTAIVNIPFGMYEGDDTQPFHYINARIRKWDGTTETEIAQASGSVYNKSTGGASTYGYGLSAIKIPMSSTYHFKKGETLRLTLEQYGKKGAIDNAHVTVYYMLGHDPKNRATSPTEVYTFGTEPTIATLQIPIKLDI